MMIVYFTVYILPCVDRFVYIVCVLVHSLISVFDCYGACTVCLHYILVDIVICVY